ncbi:DUF2254 domain-containing protein [Blastococcus jejuensis]|uniref:DUF2254 domain-containing protein n=1 Tax=Blastococcus jejuensis TaxID=351224 RepID=A0ABP6NVE3_9ACTN
MSRLRAAITGALWPLPALAVLVAIGLGIGLPEVDALLQAGVEEPLAFVFSGGPSAARTILSAIASSLISVTTLLFSLTIVTLQLASSQYSPRLLQTFVRDRVVQSCLAILLGTFLYALTVLRSVRSADESGSGAFVPRLSVTLAFLLTLVSVGALVAFLSHQTRQLRVETMLRDVHVEAGATLRRLARVADDAAPTAAWPAMPEGARPVPARGSGFLVALAEAQLVEAVAAAGAVVRLVPRPGDPVITGTPLAWAWPDGAGTALDEEALGAALQAHATLNYEREDHGDPSYGLRKLVDITTRALSPGINDPTTAVHALSHVSDLLGVAAQQTTWDRRLVDAEGQVRLLVPSWDFPALLDLALTQPRHYGGEDPTVVDRLFALLAEVGWRVTRPDQRAALREQRDLLVAQCVDRPPTGWDADEVRRRGSAVDDALARRRPTS